VPPVACGRYSITVSASPTSVAGMVRLSGLEIECKIEAGGTFHGKIRRLVAVEDTPGIHPDVPIRVEASKRSSPSEELDAAGTRYLDECPP